MPADGAARWARWARGIRRIGRRRRRRRGDGGFTLVEALITVAITGVMAAATAASMEAVFRNDSATSQRFTGANDSLTATNLFPADVASTPPGGREDGAGLASGCAGSDPAGSRNVLRLTWSERTGGGSRYFRVSYRVVNDAGGDGNLLRLSCTSTSGPDAGYGTAESRVAAGDLQPVPPGWSGGAPAALSYASLDDQDLTLTLSLATDPPSTVTIGGTRMNPANTLPPPPVEVSTAGLRVLTTTAAEQFTATGGTLEFSTTVFNSGTAPLTGVSITDPAADGGTVACAASSLAPDASTTCTFTHTVTQADLDSGGVTSRTTATGTAPDGAGVTALSPAVSIGAVQTLQMTATKGTDALNYKVAGDVLGFAVIVENTGNATLSDLTVADPRSDGPITCPATTLAPGATVGCEYQYTVTSGDLVVGGSVTSAAEVSAEGPRGNAAPAATSNSVQVPFQASPAMNAVKAADQHTFSAAGVVVRYGVTVTNTGNVALDGLAVSDPKDDDGSVPCAATSLAPGAQTVCTAEHVATALDVGSGRIVNQATASATPASGGTISATSNEETVVYSTAPAVRVTTTATPATFRDAGEVVTYTYTVHNSGGIAVTNVRVEDPRIGLPPTPCGSGSLAPLAEASCSATYTTAAGDVGAAITSTATARADSADGPASATGNAVTVNFLPDPRLTVTLGAAPYPEFSTLNEVITYTMTVTNTGNVPLSSVGITAVTIGDPPACEADTLAAGASTTCTSTYTTTSADAGGRPVTNTVTASGSFGETTAQATSGSLTVGSTVPCSVREVTAAPATIARVGGNGANKDKLSADVVVTVATSGKCSGLRLQYYPQGTLPGVVDKMAESGGTWTYTIQRANGRKSSDWRAGPARVDVLPASSTTPIGGGPFQPFTVT